MPADKWDQYAQAPGAGGDKWEQYAQPGEQSAPAPTSGAIPGAYKPTMPTPGVADNAAYEAVEGAKGFGKGLAQTAQTIHNNNTPRDPRNSLFANPENYAGSGVNTTAENPDQQMGKFLEAGAEMAAPIGDAKAMLPSASRAGAKLSELSSRFADTAVPLTHTAAPLERAEQIGARGGGPMGATGNLLDRSRMGAATPLKFPEARDYYTNVSKLTSLDHQGMSDPLKGQVNNVRAGFHEDLANAADQAAPVTQRGYLGQAMDGGRAEYENAMNEYRHGKQIQGIGGALTGNVAKKIGLGAAGALGAGEAYRHGKDLFDR